MARTDDADSSVFARKIVAHLVADGDHELWQGPTDRFGRALLRTGGHEVGVRRQMWRAAGCDIPPGAVLWGTCARTECVAACHSRLFTRAARHGAAEFDQYLAERTAVDGDCLIFQGKSNRVRLDGRRIPVGKAVWEHAHGPVPEGWMVCHRCDRQYCGRLEHLYVALPEQRVRDSVERQRFPVGEQVSQAKLTWAAVEHIRSSTDSRAALARRCRVSVTAIYKVRAGKSWQTRPSGIEVPAPPADQSAAELSRPAGADL